TLQEPNDFGFRLQILRTVPSQIVLGELIAGERRPKGIIGRGDMFDLQGKRAHTFVFTPWNLQTFRREIELILRHGLRRFYNFLFDGADLTVHGRSYGWWQLLRLSRARSCGALGTLSQRGCGKDEQS